MGCHDAGENQDDEQNELRVTTPLRNYGYLPLSLLLAALLRSHHVQTIKTIRMNRVTMHPSFLMPLTMPTRRCGLSSMMIRKVKGLTCFMWYRHGKRTGKIPTDGRVTMPMYGMLLHSLEIAYLTSFLCVKP